MKTLFTSAIVVALTAGGAMMQSVRTHCRAIQFLLRGDALWPSRPNAWQGAFFGEH